MGPRHIDLSGLTVPTLMGMGTAALPPSSFATGSGVINMVPGDPAVLLLLTLTLGLAIPVVAHYVPTFRSLTKDTPAFGLNIWDSGALASAHHTMTNDCQSCHGEPFSVVQDDKCIVCHANTKAHADPVKYPLPDIAEARCAHCHRDHNGDIGLVRADQELCSDCHRNLTERVNNDTQLANVGDFGTDHPQFKVLLPAWDAFVAELPDASRAASLSAMLQQAAGTAGITPLGEKDAVVSYDPLSHHLVAEASESPSQVRIVRPGVQVQRPDGSARVLVAALVAAV